MRLIILRKHYQQLLARKKSKLNMIQYGFSEVFQQLWELLTALLSYETDPGFNEDLLEVLFEDDGSHYETERISGVVTKLNDNQSIAVINHDIYMDLAIPVPGGKKLRLNDFVVALVKRRSEDDAWRVERVEIVERASTWQSKIDTEDLEELQDIPPYQNHDHTDPSIEHLQSKTIVGQVTGVSNKLTINNGEFELSQDGANGITYIIGDWLTMKILFDPEEPDKKAICTAAEPLRKWKFEGRINIFEENKGIIDNDIFFNLAVCINGYNPCLRDFVHVTAIESNAGGEDFMWRAVSVVPASNSARAKKNADLSSTRTNLKEAREISIEKETDFGTVEIGSEKEIRIEITNMDLAEHTLLNAKFLNMQTNFEILNQSFPVIVPINGKVYVEIFFKASTMGKVDDIIEFDFGKFIVERSLSADVRGIESLTGVNSAIPFLTRFKQRHQISRRQVMEDDSHRESHWVMKGVRPFKPPPFTTVRLAQYPVPRSLWQTIQQNMDLIGSNPSLSDILQPKNYCIKFQTLLHLEEIETTVRLRGYDIDRASLKRMGPYLALEVAGLAEKRPSLIAGDGVILSNPWGGGGLSYEGFVHTTFKSEALIQFHPDFHQKYNGEDYAVRFLFNRTTMRRYHTAVETSAKHPGYKILFPSDPQKRPPQVNLNFQLQNKTSVADRLFQMKSEEYRIEWINPCLNTEQRRAVLRILEGVHRPIPYVIYGPPGTGKTVTVVEAILQVFLLCPRSRILVATPSNSSADLIAHRLHESGRVGVGEMVRLNAFSRKTDTMPESIQPYSMTCEDLQKAIRHRILVTTCTTSGKMYTMCLQVGHFTHLFIDEAGQATEPESLVSIGLIRCDYNPGQIILAGDPKQLGPVLMSQYASTYGLSVSLLERLSNNPLYSRNKEFADSGYYNPNLLTKLVRNYRSHPSLLTLPSLMFYENELVCCASVETAEKMAHFSWLPKPGIPLLFHGIRGENYQETDSPSWCNPAEVYHVIRYLQLLLNSKVDPVNVGVITPYRKQVEKIRNFIKSNDLFPFKVGSVEEFQGQERDVIIVSTVRSHEYFVEKDVIQHLGFLRSPKRFNVTVTRAKSLLIVIGNPHLLIHDEYWGPFLKHCAQLGAYTGCDLPDL